MNSPLKRVDPATDQEVAMGRRRLVRYLLLLLLLAVGWYAFSPALRDLARLYELRDTLSYFWLVLAALMQIAQYGTEGYFIKLILRVLHFDIDWKDTARIASLDVFASHVLPLGQFGSFAATVYFYRKLGVDSQGIVLLNLALGLVAALVLIFLFLLSLITIPTGTYPFHLEFRPSAVVLLVVTVVATATIVALRSTVIRKPIEHRLQKMRSYHAIRQQLAPWTKYRTLLVEQKWKFLGVVVLKHLVYDAADVITVVSCFLTFHVFPSFAVVTLAYVLSVAASYITLVPGGLGSSDAALGIVFLSAGIDPIVVVGVLLLYRVTNLVLPTLIGALSYFSLRQELRTPA